MANKEYTEKDIELLSERDHVRLRTQIFLGSMRPITYPIPIFINGGVEVKDLTFTPAVYKSVGEILDNAVDEFAQSGGRKRLTIVAAPEKGEYLVQDNGRGIPIGKHSTGKYTPEVALGSLRAGRNFGADKDEGVIGQNGVGSACVNYCSESFEITIHRDNKVYTQTFTNGADKVTKPKIEKKNTTATNRGTAVSFQLDPLVFENVSLPEEMMRNRALEIAMTNPDITVQYCGDIYRCHGGMDDIVRDIVSHGYTLVDLDGETDRSAFKFEAHKEGVGMEFHVILGVNDDIDEKMFTWVNSSLLFDGGICNTQFINAFVDRTIKHLTPAAKKVKVEVTKNDVRRALLVLGSLKLSDPEYDAQSKTRLTGPNLRLPIGKMVEDGWAGFARKNKRWLEIVLERAMVRYHARANKEAIKDHQKNIRRKVPGLIDANSSNRSACQILVTEGDSAAAFITNARDTNTTASLPLSGKVNNVYGTTPAQLLNMGKMTDLLSAIGLTPGRKALRSELRYGRVVIATDADYDGSDIFTLLVNLFFTHWPELFDSDYQPFVYRLLAPNVCLVKGKTRVHFPTRDAYEKGKGRYRGYSAHYYKGLGSMSSRDWEMVLQSEDTLIPIQDDGTMKQTLELLFGPSADARKLWLQKED